MPDSQWYQLKPLSEQEVENSDPWFLYKSDLWIYAAETRKKIDIV